MGRLYCAGVEYQIEHHLFPGMSPTHYPHIAPMVEAFCRRHGYPYRTLGWGEALWKSYLTFWRLKPVRSDLEAHSPIVVPKRDTSQELRGTGYVSALDQMQRISQ